MLRDNGIGRISYQFYYTSTSGCLNITVSLKALLQQGLMPEPILQYLEEEKVNIEGENR